MKIIFKKIGGLVLGCLFCLTLACKKFLDEKPDAKLAIASSINDYQALLDKYNVINYYDVSSSDASAGETYLTDADFNARAQEDQRLYTWETSLVFTPLVNDWTRCYQNIYYANTVIEGMPDVARLASNANDWDNALGQGYFIRGRSFLQALGTWCVGYDAAHAKQELGIPLRVGTDFNKLSERASLEAGYQQVVADLKMAITLLPAKPLHVMRASKPAAYLLLARTYLWMNAYEQAGLYADSCLQLNSKLVNFSSLNAGATYPIAQFNAEVLFSAKMNAAAVLTASRAKINPALYSLYEANDLRKTVFFKNNGNGSFAFKGSYDGSSSAFSGMATDEAYLIRAECNVRNGKIAAGLADLNYLLASRYASGKFVPLVGSDADVLLARILQERRKELINRGLRWMDIKRLNVDGAGISLTRTVNGQTYQLPAGSKRFALPIPEDVLPLSKIVQNGY